MRRNSPLSSLLLTTILLTALAPAQQLTVQTETGKTVLSRADIETLPRAKVATGSAAFEGVALKDLLEKGGVALGEAIKGKRLASCLVVEAADGYRAVIALPEIDPAFTDKQVILALLKDGKPLDAREGPYRIVMPEEKRMARWVRQVTTLKIVEVQ
jgi:hypothetical protein